MNERRVITYGPSKFEIAASLFECKSPNRIEVRFCLGKKESRYDHPFLVVINSISRCSDSPEEFDFDGFHLKNGNVFGEIVKVKGFFETDRRFGWIEY